jgi:hypothetical protein
MLFIDTTLLFNEVFIQVMSYCIINVSIKKILGATMLAKLVKGEKVRHIKMERWGVGKIVTVHRCGTIRVIFEGHKEVSMPQGSKYLTKVS